MLWKKCQNGLWWWWWSSGQCALLQLWWSEIESERCDIAVGIHWSNELFLNGPHPASFSLFSSFQFTETNVQCKYKFLPMTGFEPRTSGIGSDRSTNWAKTTSLPPAKHKMLCLWNYKKIENKRTSSPSTKELHGYVLLMSLQSLMFLRMHHKIISFIIWRFFLRRLNLKPTICEDF